MAPTKAVMPVLLKLWASAANAATAHIDQNVPNIPTKPDSCKDRNINTTCTVLKQIYPYIVKITISEKFTSYQKEKIPKIWTTSNRNLEKKIKIL